MNIYEYIGEQLQKLREESRLSQEVLAKEIGVSTNTISRWETATYKLSLKDLQKIANFFNVGLSTLLPAEEKEQPLVKVLLSATGGLPREDIEELIKYADYRRARHLLERTKKS